MRKATIKNLFRLIFISGMGFSGLNYAQTTTQETFMPLNLEQINQAPTLAEVSPKNYHWLNLTNPIPTSDFYPNNVHYIPSKDNKIVYFDSYWGASEKPIDDGYYRKLLGKTTNGQLVVQDFFQANHAPQSSSLVLEDDDIYGLSSVGLSYSFHKNGDLQNIFYSTDNHVLEMVYVKNQQYVARSVFDGKDNLANEKLYLLDDKQQIYAYSYLPDNQKIFVITLFYPNQSMRYWRKINLETKVSSEKAWDIYGKEITPNQDMRLESLVATEKTKPLYLLDIMDKVINFMKDSKH